MALQQHQPTSSAFNGTSSWGLGVYVCPVCLHVLSPDSLPPRYKFLATIFHAGLWGFLNCVFLAKAEVKRILSTSALSISCITRNTCPFRQQARIFNAPHVFMEAFLVALDIPSPNQFQMALTLS